MSARQAEENAEVDPNTASSQRPHAATSAVPLGFWGPIGLWADEPCTLPVAKVPLHAGGDASLSEVAARLYVETSAHACPEV